MKYRPEVDGLRAIAVIPVILFHAGLPFFEGGFVGVDVFFVISGYLITSILLDDLEKDRFSIVNFYERRARRILPALFLVMACCIPAAWFLSLPQELSEFSESVIGTTLFGSNIVFWRQSDYFATAAEFKPLLHTWSLSIEEQFYLLFPPVLALLWGIRRRQLIPVLAICGVGLVSLGLAHFFSTRSATANFFLLPSRAWELSLGALAAFSLRESPGPVELSPSIRGTLAILGLMLIIFSVLTFDRHTPFPSFWALIPTGGTLLILLFGAKDTLAGRMLSRGYVVFVGLISYSAYLWHQPLYAFARQYWNGDPALPYLVLLAGLSLALAALSWRFVERPFRDRARFSRKHIFVGSATGMAIFLAIGALGVIKDGFPDRYDSRFHEMLNTERDVRYQGREAAKYKSRVFASDERPKVLIVGDSYALDVINALAEVGQIDKLNLSLHHISGACGNLYVKEDLSEYIELNSRASCRAADRYESELIRERIQQADEVWLVSAWSPWVISYLPQSISNLKAKYGDKFVVFGTKGVGTINLRSIMQDSRVASLENIRQRPREIKIQVNETMRQSEYSSIFVDLFGYLCDADYSCPIVTQSGKLISFDGGHLTAAGARKLGGAMLEDPPSAALRSVLDADNAGRPSNE